MKAGNNHRGASWYPETALKGHKKGDNILFHSSTMAIGTFDLPVTDHNFHDTGPIGGYLLVFPREPVIIRHLDKRPRVADHNTIMYYNRGQEYVRDPLSPYGDLCDFFGFAPGLIFETLESLAPGLAASDSTPFRLPAGPCRADLYLRQRRLVQTLAQTPDPDPLMVEELALGILHDSLADAADSWQPATPEAGGTARKHRDMVHHAQSILGRQFHEPVSLAALAAKVFSSPYHLCRVFKQVTGQTLHQYQRQLRLRASLARLAEPAMTATEAGIDLGFCNPSHFSQAFRQAFRLTPRQYRAGVNNAL